MEIKLKNTFLLIITAFLCSFIIPGNDIDICKLFLQNINEGKTVEAAAVCSDSLAVKFNYSNTAKNKSGYFNYLNKNLNNKSEIKTDSTSSQYGKIKFYCKQSNSFSKYLKLHQLPVLFTFSINENKIQSINIDSLKGYNDSLKINDRRWKYFESWMNQKYPSANLYYLKLQSNDSLLILAKEFFQTVVKK